MRERISMKSKMLGALALFTLIGALFVMQSAAMSPPTADAATGTIHALNVGTCLTTDLATFEDEMCKLSGPGAAMGDQAAVAWEVREEVEEVSTLYATYAFDPKTASNEPRVTMQDADLLKISISDSGRDKRTGVLIRGATNDVAGLDDDDHDTNAAIKQLGEVIRADLDADDLDYQHGDPNTEDNVVEDDIMFSSEDDVGDGIEVYLGGAQNTDSSEISDSGNHTLNFSRTGSPDIADDKWQFDPGDFNVDDGAVVRFYGCVADDNDSDCGNATIEKLDDLTVDEDSSNGEASGDLAPWLGVNASVPAGKDVVILAIYYRTSTQENLVGGKAYYYCSSDGGRRTMVTR